MDDADGNPGGTDARPFQPEPTAWSQLFAEDEFLCVKQSPGEVFESSAFA